MTCEVVLSASLNSYLADTDTYPPAAPAALSTGEVVKPVIAFIS
jgi:hypothetical protein